MYEDASLVSRAWKGSEEGKCQDCHRQPPLIPRFFKVGVKPQGEHDYDREAAYYSTPVSYQEATEMGNSKKSNLRNSA